MAKDENIRKKIELITRNTEEVLTVEDLSSLLSSGVKLRHYIGYEISGQIHLGSGLLLMGKVADFLKAGVECHIFLADWHTFINEKLDGRWETIKKVAFSYFKEGLIAALKCWGVKGGEVKFVLASDLYRDKDHWRRLMEISKHVTLSRVKRSLDIAGRQAGEEVDFAKLIYPPLQVADIFTLKVNLAHAGLDQRKAHVIARKVAPFLDVRPPVVVHSPLLLGIKRPPIWPIKKLTREVKIALKMSKSDPLSCIYIHDSPSAIKNKVRKAFCPPQEVKFNPILNWVKHLIFWGGEKGEIMIKRPAKFGGNQNYSSYSQLEKDYQQGRLHPLDLKEAVAEWLIKKLAPARKHFSDPKRKEGLALIERFS